MILRPRPYRIERVHWPPKASGEAGHESQVPFKVRADRIGLDDIDPAANRLARRSVCSAIRGSHRGSRPRSIISVRYYRHSGRSVIQFQRSRKISIENFQATISGRVVSPRHKHHVRSNARRCNTFYRIAHVRSRVLTEFPKHVPTVTSIFRLALIQSIHVVLIKSCFRRSRAGQLVSAPSVKRRKHLARTSGISKIFFGLSARATGAVTPTHTHTHINARVRTHAPRSIKVFTRETRTLNRSGLIS